MWVKTQSNAQFLFQKLNFDNSCQKTRKIKYYILEVLSSFIAFPYFMPNTLARTVSP